MQYTIQISTNKQHLTDFDGNPVLYDSIEEAIEQITLLNETHTQAYDPANTMKPTMPIYFDWIITPTL